MILLPGDVILYRPTKGLFGRLIALKTWHNVSHVETYVGGGQTVASRDGLGVGRYPLRWTEMTHVLRPVVPFNLETALAWHQTVEGRPYGWADLLNFMLPKRVIDSRGMFCSEHTTCFLREGKVPVFLGLEPAGKVAPFEFLLSELFRCVWASGTGEVVVA